jgi:hypothetical protein
LRKQSPVIKLKTIYFFLFLHRRLIMNARINVGWGSGNNTFLLSLTTATLYSYEDDHKVVHEKYKGMCYYTSCSGKSGAGFIQPEAWANDLVFPGSFRTDADFSKLLWQDNLLAVRTYKKGGWEPDGKICLFVPYRSHDNIDYDKPMVASDGRRVAFIRACPGEGGMQEVIQKIQDWETLEFQSKELKYYDKKGKEQVLNWGFYNPSHLGGIDAIRFVDLQDSLLQYDDVVYPADHPAFNRKVGLVQLASQKGEKFPYWFVQDRYGIIVDSEGDTDPYYAGRDYPNTGDEAFREFSGWNAAPSPALGLFWRRFGDSIVAILEVRREDIVGGEGSSEWVATEEKLSVFEWFSKPIETHYDTIKTKLLKECSMVQRTADTEDEFVEMDATPENNEAYLE